MVKTHGFPVKFSLKPIHWNLAISGTTYLSQAPKTFSMSRQQESPNSPSLGMLNAQATLW